MKFLPVIMLSALPLALQNIRPRASGGSALDAYVRYYRIGSSESTQHGVPRGSHRP